MADLSNLPDDVRTLIQPHIAESDEMLDAISVAIAQKRDEAKKARTSSGIETIWREAEEAYIGIDDANRHEFKEGRWSKPMSPDGPVTTSRMPRETDTRSTAFVRLTARYVDAGSGKLTEILLPADDKPFSFSETPVPELIEAKEDTSQVVHDGMGNVPLMRSLKPGETPPQSAVPTATQSNPSAPTSLPAPGAAPAASSSPAGASPQPTQSQQVPLTVKDLAEENIEIAHKAAKKAEERIYDWMVESQYTAEMRKVIFDSAKLGVGVLKGPFPKPFKNIASQKSKDGTIGVLIEEKIKPAYRQIDPWNIFPDPGCGENICDGEYIFERDYLSRKQVRDLNKVTGYITSQIDKVLEEGPEGSESDSEGSSSHDPNKPNHKGRFEVWYCYTSLSKKDIDIIGEAAGKDFGLDDDTDEVYAIVTLLNKCVVRATINPLDSGSFPYHSMPWQRRAGAWAGIGVAEQCAMPQKAVNAATRAMFNNAGKSAGSQFVLDQSLITPADGTYNIYPDKIWLRSGDGAGIDIRQAFMAIEIPNVTAQMMSIIEYGMKLAEECTSIPLISQGQTGPTTPQTLGAAQIQNSNANQLLRSIGYTVDDNVTEPVVRNSYEWLLLDPDVPDDEKGDFDINAHGSVALVERAIADQTIAQLLPLANNPNNAYAADPKKCFAMYLKSKKLNPEDFQYSEEDQAKLAKQQTAAPQVQAAQINADTQLKLGAMKQTTEQQSVQSEERIAQAAQTLEGQKTQVGATVALHTVAEQQKAELAKTAMELNVQQVLNAADHAHDFAKPKEMAPPVQVPGRAADGHAFDQSEGTQ